MRAFWSFEGFIGQSGYFAFGYDLKHIGLGIDYMARLSLITVSVGPLFVEVSW